MVRLCPCYYADLGTAELFYKKGARPDEQYSHLKIGICVGAVMGLHAIFTLLTQDINFNPINILRYLPVSLLYIGSMIFSYFGMRLLGIYNSMCN